MFPVIILLAVAYLLCVVFVSSSMANAPEAHEDEAGFHYLNRAGLSASAAAGWSAPRV